MIRKLSYNGTEYFIKSETLIFFICESADRSEGRTYIPKCEVTEPIITSN